MTSVKSESISSSTKPVLLREQKAQLDERILQTEMQLENLKAQRVLVEQELSKIVYPILSLPSELTTKIFASAVATGVAEHKPVLLQLAAVCQQWRAVALDNPVLWQCIAFTSDVDDPEQLFLCFATRSGTLSLHISIFVRTQYGWEIPQAILHSSARWKTAHFLTYRGRYPSVSVPSELSGGLALPLLEELTMNLHTDQWEDRVMLLRDAPCLHNLCFGAPKLVPLVGLPMEQLQTLEFLDEGPIVELLEVLRHTSNLGTLILPRQEWELVDPFTGPPLPIYHNLHTLSCVSGFVSVVINQLTAPALQTLHLPGMDMDDELLAAVRAFLTRSGCSIRKLFLNEMEYEMFSQLITCPAFESVFHLTLAVQFMSEEDSSDFSSLLGDGTFLPGLKSFTIIVPFGGAGIIEPYLSVVSNRAKRAVELESTSPEGTAAISRIDEFTLEFKVDELKDNDKQNLEHLAQELGVQVIIPSHLPSVQKWSTGPRYGELRSFEVPKYE
ncbi:hypothetical protein C8F01DRAFT_673501 [Mycena amicta]|nr:hypothetical protein C8F01DRAFT_673501 [Mycena amicta]